MQVPSEISGRHFLLLTDNDEIYREIDVVNGMASTL